MQSLLARGNLKKKCCIGTGSRSGGGGGTFLQPCSKVKDTPVDVLFKND